MAGSNHPLARATTRHAEQVLEHVGVQDQSETRHERTGSGLRISCSDGSVVIAGSTKWLQEHSVPQVPLVSDATCSRVLIARNGIFVGAIELSDTLRSDATVLLNSIRAGGIEPILISGDTSGCVAEVAKQLDLSWHAEVNPEGKRQLIEQLQAQGRTVAFVGDG